jgi:hypothetical protein
MLTDVAIRKAKPGERLAKLSDGGGLQLWITPTGGKLWYLAYRFGGRQKKLAMGAYGAAPVGVTLEAAEPDVTKPRRCCGTASTRPPTNGV